MVFFPNLVMAVLTAARTSRAALLTSQENASNPVRQQNAPSLSLDEPVVNLHRRTNAGEEGRVQLFERDVDVGKDWNARGERAIVSTP